MPTIIPNATATTATTAATTRESHAFRAALEVVAAAEPNVAAAIRSELADQRGSLKLIASENYASPAVLLAMGNWFSDKYAEGTIGRRMYAGCHNVDTIEQLAADHARALVRRRPRLRAAPFGDRRQPGGVLGRAGAAGRSSCPRRRRSRLVDDLDRGAWDHLRGRWATNA
jgi:glycine hydroxymethyltransferase